MDKKTIGILGGLVLLAVVFLLVFYNRTPADLQPGTTNQLSNGQPEPTASPTPTGSKLSYGEAIKTYKYRFQFSNCHATPGTISVKKGQPVMLDNRDKVAHTIKANGQSFRIAGYNYALVYPAIVTKDNVDLTLSNITCDGGGAGTLNVEK